jgi:hypothetical protein
LPRGSETARPECLEKGCIRSWINILEMRHDKVMHH